MYRKNGDPPWYETPKLTPTKTAGLEVWVVSGDGGGHGRQRVGGWRGDIVLRKRSHESSGCSLCIHI